MGAGPNPAPGEGWTIQRAERLLQSLTGVVSVRVVAKPGGEIEEIHVLTTEEVGPKQTVRNVESALLAQLDLTVDHRKISVAQTKEGVRTVPPDEPVLDTIPRGSVEDRVLFVGHGIESERSHSVLMKVTVEWRGEQYEGVAAGTDLPRTRLEAAAGATLRAIEKALFAGEPEAGAVTLALDGVKLVEAFERTFVLVAVHALTGRDVTPLAGAATVSDAPDRAVILATLQATDRWVRGRA